MQKTKKKFATDGSPRSENSRSDIGGNPNVCRSMLVRAWKADVVSCCACVETELVLEGVCARDFILRSTAVLDRGMVGIATTNPTQQLVHSCK